MPDTTDKQSPEDIISNVILAIQTKITGPDASQHLIKIKKSTDKVRKALAPTIKQFKKLSKALGSRTFKTFAKMQKVIGVAVKKTTGLLSRQTKRLRDHHRQMRQNIRANRSFVDSFLKLSLIVAGVTLALRKLQRFASTRIDVRLLGVDLDRLEKLLAGTGLRDSLTFDLVSQFGALGLPQQFLAQNEVIQKGLIEFQKSFAGLGQERGNQLIIDLAKSVPEPSRLLQLFSTAASGAVKDALLAAQDDRSIGEVTRALNALVAQKEIAEGKASPALEAAVATQKSLDAMSAAIEGVSNKLIGEFSGAITTISNAMTAAAARISSLESGTVKTLAAVGVVGAGLAAVGSVVLPGLLALKGLSIAKGVIGGLAAGSTQALPVIEGFAAKRVAEETVKRTAPRLLGLASRAIATAATAGKAIAATGIGSAAVIGAPVAAGGLILGKPILDRQKLLEQQVKQIANNEQQRSNLFAMARDRQRTATNEVDRLRGKRLEIDSIIMGALPDSRVIEKLRAQRMEIVQQIDDLIAKQSKLVDQQKKLKTATDKAVAPLKAVSKAIKSVTQSSLQLRLQQSVSRAPGLQQATELQASITDLRRLERDIASATVLGPIGALPQLQQLQDAQRQDLQAIQRQLENLVINGPHAEIQANKLRSQQLQIMLRMRQDTQNLVSSFDLFGKVLGAGSAFEKILITSRKNLGIGIRQGFVNSPLEQIFGSTKGKGLRPRTLESLGISLPFDLLPATPSSIPKPPSQAEKLTRQMDEKTEQLIGLFAGALEGFKRGGLSDTIERGKKIAAALVKANDLAQRIQTQNDPQSQLMIPRLTNDQVAKRHPKAKRLSFSSGIGGAADKLEAAAKLLSSAARDLPDDDTIETDDRSVKSGQILN